MYVFSIRSGVIESDQHLPEWRTGHAGTSPIDAEPYVEVCLDDDTGSGFTAEEEAFFAEGDELERQLDDDGTW
jgi:hypothetical protein